MPRFFTACLQRPRRRLMAILIVLCILVVALWLVFHVKSVNAVAVKKIALSQSVVATGRVTTSARISIGSQVTATVVHVAVKEGQHVRSGQALVQLRSSDAQAALRLAQSQLEQARQQQIQLNEVTAPVNLQNMKKAEADLTFAKSEYQRTKTLVQQGFYAPAALDSVAHQLNTAQAQQISAKTQWQSTQKGGAHYALLQAQLDQAQAQLAKAQADLDLLTLRAPVDAQVLTRNVEPGDVAKAGDELLSLAQTGQLRIYASMDEKNLPLLREGLTAKVVADAFVSRPFDATLYYISPSVDAQRATVELRFNIPHPPKFLRPDMTVSVQAVIGHRDNALVLPADALHGQDTLQPWVIAVREGRAVHVPVQLGLVGIGVVEILSGLKEGEWVVFLSEAVKEGQRVKPHATEGAMSQINSTKQTAWQVMPQPAQSAVD